MHQRLALSLWHSSGTLSSAEPLEQNGQTDRVNFAAHTKHAPPELDLPFPTERTPPFAYPVPNTLDDHIVAGQHTMPSAVTPKTRWSAQQDVLIKERLATPLPRVQMGMYLFAPVVLGMMDIEGGPCCPAILLILHLAEPMCATVIHPFIAQAGHLSIFVPPYKLSNPRLSPLACSGTRRDGRRRLKGWVLCGINRV